MRVIWEEGEREGDVRLERDERVHGLAGELVGDANDCHRDVSIARRIRKGTETEGK